MTLRPAFVVLALVLLHALAVVFAGLLPAAFGPALAATVYLPLWPLSALGVPVFGAAPSGGWAGPSVLGWALWGVSWAVLWSVTVGLLVRRHGPPSPPKA